MNEHDLEPEVREVAPPAAPSAGGFSRLASRLRSTPAGRGTLTLVTVAALGAVGIVGSTAAFSDDVTMAQITIEGGTLDLEASDSATDEGVAWAGSLSADVSDMVPGDSATGTVKLENAGSVDFTLTGTSTGTDASGCFEYWLTKTSDPATGIGFGTGAAPTTLATGVTGQAIAGPQPGGVWSAADAIDYTLAVRMKASCTTNAAAGTLDVSFAASQA